MQYINWKKSPYPDKPAPDFLFELTDDKPLAKNFVEPIPIAAAGGVKMPELKNKPGVKVTLDKITGIVGEPVKLTASGLPSKKMLTLFGTLYEEVVLAVEDFQMSIQF